MTILRACFPGQVISRFGDIEWDPRSPDLSRLDFFQGGYLKGRVYLENLTLINQLKRAIRNKIALITIDMIAGVMRNMRKKNT